MASTILFADNDGAFLKTRAKFLEKEGYKVVPAGTFTEARRILEQAVVDLAILDLRLNDDDDDKDISGLTLAKETSSTIPKVILTNFPTIEAVREALGPNSDGIPSAVAFVSKQEGPEAMLRAVRRALEFGGHWFRNTQDNIADQLNEDYANARREARTHYIVALTISVLGIALVFLGVVLALIGTVAIGIASTASGVVTEIVNYLMFKRADAAHRRVDEYHDELLQTKRLENLLAACQELGAEDKRQSCIEKVISSASNNWLGSSAAGRVTRNRDRALSAGNSRSSIDEKSIARR